MVIKYQASFYLKLSQVSCTWIEWGRNVSGIPVFLHWTVLWFTVSKDVSVAPAQLLISNAEFLKISLTILYVTCYVLVFNMT